jgi:hypothetical protein
MNIELDRGDIDTLILSLDYSIQQVAAQQETPPQVKHDNLEQLGALRDKLRHVKAMDMTFTVSVG